MPSRSTKQKKFFGAVMGCKKTGKCSPATTKAAGSMSKGKVKDFLKLKKK